MNGLISTESSIKCQIYTKFQKVCRYSSVQCFTRILSPDTQVNTPNSSSVKVFMFIAFTRMQDQR